MNLVISGISLVLAACQVPPAASQGAGIGESDLAGIVTSANGPEAGVWVIAETTDLPTKFARIVVTDDRGRYLIPELPKANYSVWVRGYGLVDSRKLQAAPDLTAAVAPSAAAAAQWGTYSTRTVFHVEGGKENRPRVVKFQLRPDPLAN